MNLDTITIGEEEYISSAKAASLVGYTKDYVGQLARAGKIKATRVGRSWYISAGSIRTHKLNTHYTLTRPKKQTKRENDITEKTIKNIDKTEKEKIKDFNEKRVGMEFSDNEGVDLFPKIKKNKRDVLLHTDIKYERVNIPKVAVNKSSRGKATHANVANFENISSKRGIKDIDTKHVYANAGRRNYSVRMDGVIKSKYGGKSFKVSNRNIVTARNINSSKKNIVEKNNAKTISVITSIVLFTILVLIYLFV